MLVVLLVRMNTEYNELLLYCLLQLDSIASKNNNNNNNNSLSSANGLWTGPVKAASIDTKDPLAWTNTTLWPRSDGAPSPAPSTSPAPPAPSESPAPAAPAAPTVVPVPPKDLPRPEQWLGKIATVVKPAAPVPAVPASPVPSPRRAGMLGSHSRAYSLGSAESYMGVASMNANGHHGTSATDPFNADWAVPRPVPPHAHAQVSTAVHHPAHAHAQPVGAVAPASSTNPFLGNPVSVKAFEVRM